MRPTPFIFGKVPDRGDFVRVGPLSPLLDELDTWLQRGLLVHRRPPAEAPPVGFALGRPGGVLLGAFAPSRDRAGRAFPLVAGAAVDVGPVDGALVVGQAPLLEAAVACAADVAAGEIVLAEALERLETGMQPGAEEAPGYPPAEEFGALPLERVLERMAEVLRPLRQGGPALRYGLGLPLPVDASARPTAVGFWLDAAVRLGGPPPAPSLLWTAGGDRARLALFLGPPTPDALAYLLAGTPAEGVYDLDYDLDAAPTPAPSSLRALLDRL